MARIADYMIVWRAEYDDVEAPESFVSDVKRMIEDGWEPLGGISIYSEPRSDGGSRVIFAQAMGRGYS